MLQSFSFTLFGEDVSARPMSWVSAAAVTEPVKEGEGNLAPLKLLPHEY